MEGLLASQSKIVEEMKRIYRNIKKDSKSRKTTVYCQVRVTKATELWSEFEKNHSSLMTETDKTHQYFHEDIYEFTSDLYQRILTLLIPPSVEEKKTVTFNKVISEDDEEEGIDDDTNRTYTQLDEEGYLEPTKGAYAEKLNNLLRTQKSNFRAFVRAVDNVRLETLNEKWELEDELKTLETRWGCIDRLHLQIDSFLEGESIDYYVEFENYEKAYKNMKKNISKKINVTSHQQQSTPQLSVPTFSGCYSQWPTFMDLYCEAIHNNPALSKAQKMQHLKGKLRGEAERLVQHLNISIDNYDTCWELLTHRYNNKQLLFTKQFELLMHQPTVKNQTCNELKKLFDTSMEAINAIHNLGVDTTSWDPMMVHILCEKLDKETCTEYRQYRKAPRELANLDEFFQFLEGKFTALEPLTKKKAEMTTVKPTFEQKPSLKSKPWEKKAYNTTSFNAYNVSFGPCALCDKDHALYQCAKFIDLATDSKKRFLHEHSEICVNCLFVHDKNYCKSRKRCHECNGQHNTLVHDAYYKEVNTNKVQQKFGQQPNQKKQHHANFIEGIDDEVLLATVLVQVMTYDGNYVTLRGLVDQGSQITILTHQASQLLNLPRQPHHGNINGIGGSNRSKGKVTLQCKSTDNSYEFCTDALIMTKVVNNLPNCSFEDNLWPHTKHLTLADPKYNVSRPVDLLLDADVYLQIIMSGLLRGTAQQPIAQQTKLGWILSGGIKTLNCHVVTNNYKDLTQYWEVEDIDSDKKETLTESDQYCEDLYSETTYRTDEGQYVVRLPMKRDYKEKLGSSKIQALAQFRQLEQKLTKNTELSESYKKFMEEYLNMQHMKLSNENDDTDVQYYLPHHGVLKQDSKTTKLRVVFNASARTSTKISLNELMECGPKLHQDLQAILMRWRSHKIVFSADCEKMYRMILIHEQDQKLQKIVWRDNIQDPIKDFSLCTVTYGMKASPYLALRTVKQLAIDEANTFPLATDVLKRDIYVDDVLSGADNIDDALKLQNELIILLKGAKFNLRKWSSNNPNLISHLPDNQINNPVEFKNPEATKTLGLQWIPTFDEFTFKNKISKNTGKKTTKRMLLSEISKIFDPLGWLSPLTIRAKLMFQALWIKESNWDDYIPEEIEQNWTQFQTDIQYINDIKIPRWIGDMTNTYEIFGFCDASQKAYACTIYIKTITNDKPTVRLLVAKSRVAPIKKQLTLPRLELCGAELLINLMKKVVVTLRIDKNIKINYFTDSMIVLGWIRGDINKWKSFVANRIRKITEFSLKTDWHHVKSEENPSDYGTKCLSLKYLLTNSLWWEGPEWIKNFANIEHKTHMETDIVCELKTKLTCTTTTLTSAIIIELLDRHSNLTHVVRVVAWMLRLKCKHHHKYLTTKELQYALKVIVRNVQNLDFGDDINKLKHEQKLSKKSAILNLNPFLNNDNVLCVGGRLRNANLHDTTKHPMILSHSSRLTQMIIGQAHERVLHGGPKLTLAYIRNKFWIIKVYQTVKLYIHRCVICRRYDHRTSQYQIMADLPTPRVNPSRPFSCVGVDYTGQVEVKANKGRGIRTLKGYIAVFVCLATKAIHLELVCDMTTSSFLAAFKRFCSRRGKPAHVYSDNGTNFVGANRILRQQYLEALNCIDESFINLMTDMEITWHFNAAAWPSAGGLWESAVRSMKFHLKRVIGEQKLTFEEFTTLLCQVEACLNSRPLCTLTESVTDLDYLTPGHFLIGGPLLSSPNDNFDNTNIRSRWNMLQKTNRDFWKTWSNEYLSQLQSRQKWQTRRDDIKINDIVCIKEDNLPPGKWLMGRIYETHPGKDKRVRVVTIKTKNGLLKRPITKLAPLMTDVDKNVREPQQTNNEPPQQTNNEPPQKTKPKKLQYAIYPS